MRLELRNAYIIVKVLNCGSRGSGYVVIEIAGEIWPISIVEASKAFTLLYTIAVVDCNLKPWLRSSAYILCSASFLGGLSH
jgi:hypothetical protein